MLKFALDPKGKMRDNESMNKKYLYSYIHKFEEKAYG